MLLINYTFVRPGSLREHTPGCRNTLCHCGGCSARCQLVLSFPSLTVHQLSHGCESIWSRSPLTSSRLSILYWELSEIPAILALFEVPIGHEECWAFQVRDVWMKSIQYPPQIHKALGSENSVTLNTLKGQWCSHKPHPNNRHSQSTVKFIRCTRDTSVSSRVR